MEHKKLALTLLVILLAVGVLGLVASTFEASRAAGSGVQDLAQAVPGWEQVNNNGFGDPTTDEVTALEAFNGYLYAGTHNPIDPEPLFDGAQIFRSPDGATWTAVTQPGFGVAHDTAPPAILDLTVFKGYLYAGTGRGNAAKIYRTVNGLNWAPVVNSAFGDPDNVNINALAEYNNYLYAGVTNQVSGAQIWRSLSGDSSSWTQVAPAVAGSAPAGVTAMAVFSNTLYAAVEFEADAPVQIWASNGGSSWTTIVSDGFGDSDTTMASSLAVFGDFLYAGAGNVTSGAQLWRTNDGTNWAQAISPGFGDANNQKVEMAYVFQNQLYASTKNTATGMEIWRSADGSLWEQANPDGFGDSHNTGSNGSNATADFLGQLYVGTVNTVDGGELWRRQQPFAVSLSPDASLTGTAGQTLTYTLGITNTGGLTDTFDLTAAGQTWTTGLSTSQVSLGPTASTVFSVTVTIPPGAADQESDTVTITATSQGDNSISDSAILTSTAVAAPVYGVSLSADDSLSAAAGEQVVYTLFITNTGNVVDTFDLLPSGNNWTTTLSASVITLGAGGHQAVTVTVLIPPLAAASESDQASIQATSRHDGRKSDTAVLTTVSTGQVTWIYLPVVMSGASR